MARKRPMDNKGFTLVEVVVVLAVLAIISSLTVMTLVPWYESYKQTEREYNAEIIYESTQAGFSDLKSQGRLARVNAIVPSNELSQQAAALDSAAASDVMAPASLVDQQGSVVDSSLRCYSSDVPDQLALIQTVDGSLEEKISKVGFMTVNGPSGHYCIEASPTLGYTYAVFYSENYFNYADASAHRNDGEWLADNKVAYYGGTALGVFDPQATSISCFVGYFEFSGPERTGDITGMYGYNLTVVKRSDGSKFVMLDAAATSLLPTDNVIGSTAYGVLVTSDHASTAASMLNGSALSLKGTSHTMSIGALEPVSYQFYPSALKDAASSNWTPVRGLSQRFQVNTDFAAAIVTASDSLQAYQVRTPEQLRNINKNTKSPTGSSDAQLFNNLAVSSEGAVVTYQQNPSDKTLKPYLTYSYFQTHDILLEGDWTPIGVEDLGSNEHRAVAFSGSYCAAFHGQAASQSLVGEKTTLVPETLAAPEAVNSNYFQIRLGSSFQLGCLGRTEVSSQAAATNAVSYETGLFAECTGTISYLGIAAGKESSTQLVSSNITDYLTANSDDSRLAIVGVAVGTVKPNGRLVAPSLTCSAGSLSLGTEDEPLSTGKNTDMVAGMVAGMICGGTVDGLGVDLARATLAVGGKGAASTVVNATDGNCVVGSIIGEANDSAIISGVAVRVNDEGALTASAASSGEAFSSNGIGLVTSGALSLISVEASDGGSLSSTANGKAASLAGAVIASFDQRGNAPATVVSSSLKVSEDSRLTVDAVTQSNGCAYAGALFGHLNGAISVTNPSCSIESKSRASLDAHVKAVGESACGLLAGCIEDEFTSVKTSDGSAVAATLDSARVSVKAATDSRVGSRIFAYAGGLVGLSASSQMGDVPFALEAKASTLSIAANNDDSNSRCAAGGLFGRITQPNLGPSALKASRGSKVTIAAKSSLATGQAKRAGGVIGYHDKTLSPTWDAPAMEVVDDGSKVTINSGAEHPFICSNDKYIDADGNVAGTDCGNGAALLGGHKTCEDTGEPIEGDVGRAYLSNDAVDGKIMTVQGDDGQTVPGSFVIIPKAISSQVLAGYFEFDGNGVVKGGRYYTTKGSGGLSGLSGTLSTTGSIGSTGYGSMVRATIFDTWKEDLGTAAGFYDLGAVRNVVVAGADYSFVPLKKGVCAFCVDETHTASINVNQDFAAAVNTDSLGKTFQVRTAEQLQNINSNADYATAGHVFVQTHDITIDEAWEMIGSTGNSARKFMAAYFGGFGGKAASKVPSTLSTTGIGANAFEIKLGRNFSLAKVWNGDSQGATATRGIKVNGLTGLFGYVGGGMTCVTVVVDGVSVNAGLDALDLPSGDGVAAGGVVAIAASKLNDVSLVVRNGGSFTLAADKKSAANLTVGGVVGMTSNATCSDISTSVDGGSTLTLGSNASGRSYCGAVVGWAVGATLTDASFESAGTTSISVKSTGTEPAVAACVSGLSEASLSQPAVTLKGGSLNLQTDATGTGHSQVGLVAGAGSPKIKEPQVSLTNGAKAALYAHSAKQGAHAGGLVGYLWGSSAVMGADGDDTLLVQNASLSIKAEDNTSNTNAKVANAGGLVGVLSGSASVRDVLVHVNNGALKMLADSSNPDDGGASYAGGVVAQAASSSASIQGAALIAEGSDSKVSVHSLSGKVESSVAGGVIGYAECAVTGSALTLKGVTDFHVLGEGLMATSSNKTTASGGLIGFGHKATVTDSVITLNGQSVLKVGAKPGEGTDETRCLKAGGFIGFHSGGVCVAEDGGCFLKIADGCVLDVQGVERGQVCGGSCEGHGDLGLE